MFIVSSVFGQIFLSGSFSLLQAATLIIDQKESYNHPHVTVTLLGFSKQGQMAVLEEQSPGGNEYTGISRQFTVFSLVTDKVLAHSETDIDAGDTQAGPRFDTLLHKTLTDRSIDPVRDVKLEKFPLKRDPDAVGVEVGPAKLLPEGTPSRLEDGFESGEGCLEYRIILKSALKGSKEIGRMRSVPSSYGVNPVSPPVLLGYIRDPYADRVVIILQQDITGVEAWTTPLYRFMGARLDIGFKK